MSTDIVPPAAPAGAVVMAKLSHYWPPLGGPNCFSFIRGECVSRMASGERWQDWTGRAAACVREWPFWTRLTLPGGEEFVCLDRGGAIRTGADGLPWIDLLVQHAPVPFGAVVPVSVVYP